MIRSIPTQANDRKVYMGREAVVVTTPAITMPDGTVIESRVRVFPATVRSRFIRRAASVKMQVGTDAEVTTAKVAEEAKLAAVKPTIK